MAAFAYLEGASRFRDAVRSVGYALQYPQCIVFLTSLPRAIYDHTLPSIHERL